MFVYKYKSISRVLEGDAITLNNDVRSRVLRILEASGPEGMHQSELVEASGYSKSWISEVLGELESQGLIARVEGPGKTKRIVLSKFLDPGVGRVIRVSLVRAAEYLPLFYFITRLKGLGYSVELLFYSNVYEATLALCRGVAHLALTPLVTHAVFKSLGAPIKSYHGGAIGGASIVSLRDLDITSVATSKASTMEVTLVAYSRSKGINVGELTYYSSPGEGLELIMEGRVKSIVIWEPYATILERSGLKRVKLIDELGPYYCCFLARHEKLSPEVSEAVGDSWSKAISDLSKGVPKEELANLLNFDKELIEIAGRAYEFEDFVDWYKVDNVLTRAWGFLLNRTVMKELLSD